MEEKKMIQFDKLKEHVNYLNVAWIVKQGITPPEKAANKAKEYQREYFQEQLKQRRN